MVEQVPQDDQAPTIAASEALPALDLPTIPLVADAPAELLKGPAIEREVIVEGGQPNLLLDVRSARPAMTQAIKNIHAANFRGITPGKTRRDELVAAWGKPERETPNQGQTIMEYRNPPFQSVEVVVQDDVVASLVGFYGTPVKQSDAVTLLELAQFAPAVIYDDRGQILGQTYPERGVLFGLTKHQGAMRVAQVVLETPTAEGFLTRAEQRWRLNPQQSLNDVYVAFELNHDNARARELLPRVLLASNQAAESLWAVNEALRDAAGDLSLQLLRGEALLQTKQWDEAQRAAEQVLNAPGATAIQSAAAHLLLGNVLATSPQADLRAAMASHYEAARLATAAVKEAAVGQERDDVLWTAIQTYLAVANDLAMGHWRQPEEAFSKWVGHAERAVEALAPADVKDAWLLDVRCRVLEVSAASEGRIDPATYAAAAMQTSAQLIAAAPNVTQRAAYQARLGASLLEASQSLMVAGKREAGRNYIVDTQRLLEAAERREENAEVEYLLGRTYFFLGLDCAVAKRDHRAAAEWYAKALPLLDRPLPSERLVESGAHGQRFVTMAISLWENQQREKAVAITEKGLQFIQQAVDRGELERSAIAGPLTNLAKMNRLLGNEEKAQSYQTRLVDFQTPASDAQE